MKKSSALKKMFNFRILYEQRTIFLFKYRLFNRVLLILSKTLEVRIPYLLISLCWPQPVSSDLRSRVILGQLFNLSEPQFSHP